MKRNILTFILLLIGITMADAQQKIIIKLTDGTTIEKEVWEVDNITFSPSAPIAVPQTAQAIDLGLSVKWADFNFGATSAEMPGYYIGWGDITGNNYSKNNSYFPISNPPTDIVAGTYDIVHSMWGTDWRLPTADEVKELLSGCTWAYDEIKKGYTITSKTNSNSIFLPFAGHREGTDTLELGDKGCYWSGILGTDNTKATALVADNLTPSTSEMLRYIGCSIRPVFGKYLYGSTVLSAQTPDVTSTGVTVSVTYDGDYAHGSEFGVCYGTSESGLAPGTGSCVTATSVGTDGVQRFTITNLTPNTKYYYLPYVKYNGSSNIGTVSSFQTLAKYPVADYVDLGLSVKWASWNVGASSVDDYGKYMGWGDPTGENMSFVNSSYPNPGVNISGTSYDVAHVQWGDKWRMPTKAELTELGALPKEIVTQNGVTGFKITGSNGNSIFLPRGGYLNVSGYSDQGNKAYYWTSENSTMDNAYSCSMGKVSAAMTADEKCLHMLIRPVYDDNTGGNTGETAIDTTAAGKAASSVDLGLSVKWATYNIGSTSSTQDGNYFAWGETEPKQVFTKDNYSHYNSATATFDNIGTDIKNTEYDAARKQWGGTWRMPTKAEYQELIDNCTWTWSAEKMGYTVTSKANGNSIFLRASGVNSSSSVVNNGTQGHYWTSDYDTSVIHETDYWANRLAFTASGHFVGGTYLYYGLTIRPVRP